MFHHVSLTFGSDLHAQSGLANEISASELSRKFVKGALLVGSPLTHPLFPGIKCDLNNISASLDVRRRGGEWEGGGGGGGARNGGGRKKFCDGQDSFFLFPFFSFSRILLRKKMLHSTRT